MDPLTAFSLAGTIIQFVDFGTKILSQGYEIYESAKGQLAVDEELELITADLSGLISKMKRAKISNPPSVSSLMTGPVSSAQSSTFEKICDEATQIAQVILAKLGKLKIDETKNRELETFKQVWKRLWARREIDELVDRLTRLKDLINTEVLATIL
jgi:hypothetical protein